MSALDPQGPFDLPPPVYDPLSPPFIDPIVRASDALAEAHAAISTGIQQSLVTPRVALAGGQIAIGQQVQNAFAMPVQVLDQTQQTLTSDVSGALARAFSNAGDARLPALSPESVQAEILGVPPVSIFAPPPDGQYGVHNWRWTANANGGGQWMGSNDQGDVYNVDCGPAGCGPIYLANPGHPPPLPGGGPAIPGPAPQPPNVSCEEALSHQSQSLSAGGAVILPIECPCPAGMTQVGDTFNWEPWWRGGLIIQAKTCEPSHTPTPPPYVPPAPPTAPPATPCPPAVPCPTWKLWHGTECYILPGGQPPRSEDDELLAEGAPSTEWLKLILDKCGVPCEQPPAEFPGLRQDPTAACLGIPPNLVFEETDLVKLIDGFFGLNGPVGDNAAEGIFGRLLKIRGLPGELIRNTLRAAVRALVGPFNAVSQAAICGGPESLPINVTLTALKFLEKYVSEMPPGVTRPLEQQRNVLCPTELPSPDAANAALLANVIDVETWRCWVRAAGAKDPEWAKVYEAGRAKLTAGELAALYHRGELTAGQYADRLREGGWLKGSDPGEINTLSQQIPVLGDLIRFMVRDVGDEALVQKLGMDDQFAQKWTGQLKQFADWQAIHPDYAKLAWRAHWDLPSPTQLYEMYHRLRHDWIPDAERVTLEDVKNALVQDDKLPYWVPRYLAISFLPMGRIDLRKAYQTGAIDREGLRRGYLKLGYSDADAETLTEFTVRTVKETWANSTLVTKAVSYKITVQEVIDRLQRAGADQYAIDEVLRRVHLGRKQTTRAKCQRALQRRFFRYEFSRPELTSQLLSRGAELEEANELAEAWNCERESRGKILPATLVCGLYERGLIGVGDLYGRFLAIGYTESDASLMVTDCMQRVGQKRDKQHELALQKAAAQHAKDLKAMEAAARKLAQQQAQFDRNLSQQQTKLQKEAERIAKLRAGQQKLEEQRRKQIMSAAETIVERSTEDLSTVYHQMRTAIYQAVPVWWFTLTAAVDAATIAAKDPASIDFSTWLATWQALSVEAAAPVGLDLPPTQEVEVSQSIPSIESDLATTLAAGTVPGPGP